MDNIRTKKLLLLIFVTLPFLSCIKGGKQADYSVVLSIGEIVLNGESFQFSPVKSLTLIPNSNSIALVPLKGSQNLGVRYFLSERFGPEGRGLVHNAVFYELVNGSWTPLTEVDHREPAKMTPNTYWRIATTVDGIQKFSVAFDYTITTR